MILYLQLNEIKQTPVPVTTTPTPASNEPKVVYKTEKVNVLYKRLDGAYGVIETN